MFVSFNVLRTFILNKKNYKYKGGVMEVVSTTYLLIFSFIYNHYYNQHYC